jgi:hypothetical protein
MGKKSFLSKTFVILVITATSLLLSGVMVNLGAIDNLVNGETSHYTMDSLIKLGLFVLALAILAGICRAIEIHKIRNGGSKFNFTTTQVTFRLILQIFLLVLSVPTLVFILYAGALDLQCALTSGGSAWCGVISLLSCVFLMPVNLIGLIVSIVNFAEIHRNSDRRLSRTAKVAIATIILDSAAPVVGLICALLAFNL